MQNFLNQQNPGVQVIGLNVSVLPKCSQGRLQDGSTCPTIQSHSALFPAPA